MIDFSKVFVWRVGLCKKLMDLQINGNFFRVVKTMYQNIESCISIESNCSGFFPTLLDDFARVKLS